MKRCIPKPFSEMTRNEQIASLKNSLANLEHPHNRHNKNCMDAARRIRDSLAKLETQP